MAKATSWANTDAEVRKRGERTGLDTLVGHAVNDEYSVLASASAQAKVISIPPGEYVGNDNTQRN